MAKGDQARVPDGARDRGRDATRGGEGTRRGEGTRGRATTAQPTGARRPNWPIPLVLLGLLGLILAAILGWGVAPGRQQLPENLATTREFNGTANALLNPQALQAGDFGSALLTDVPVTGQRTVRVLETRGSIARVQEDRTLMVDGQPVGSGSNTYAVDRRSLEPATNPPAEWNATPHEGLTVSFPVNAQRQDYAGWVTDTQTTTPLRFVREEARAGVNTYVYETDTEPTPIRDPAVLASLPPSLSRADLQAMAPLLPLAAEQREMLSQALPGLPEEVPVTYTHQFGATYWVEPTTGTIIDTQQQVIRTGTIGGPGGAVLATMPVYNVDTRFDDASVSAAARDANDRRNALTMVGTTWPWVLATLGTLALVAGLLGLLARRRPQRERAVPPPSYRPDERTTRVDADALRTRQTQAGQPQPTYTGQTPHTKAYREARPGPDEARPGHEPGQPEEQQARRGQPPAEPPSSGG